MFAIWFQPEAMQRSPMEYAGLAAVAIIAIKEIAGLAKNKKNGNSGEQPKEFWQREFRMAVDEVVESKLEPVLLRQTALMEKLSDNQAILISACRQISSNQENNERMTQLRLDEMRRRGRQ